MNDAENKTVLHYSILSIQCTCSGTVFLPKNVRLDTLIKDPLTVEEDEKCVMVHLSDCDRNTV